MAYETLLVESKPPAVTVTINRAEARNALNQQVISEILAALRDSAGDDEVRCVVLTGAGEKAFSAGGDLGSGGLGGSWAQQHIARSVFSDLLDGMRGLSKPILARVNGHALGGGFGLALACDLVVAVDDAEFGTPEINVGLWPYVITALIHRNLPPKIALELMMMGNRVSASEGERWGFVNKVVSRGELDDAVNETVANLASKSPLVLRLGKESFYASEDLAFRQALSYLESQLTIGLGTEDASEGIQAFLQKRPPEWKGR